MKGCNIVYDGTALNAVGNHIGSPDITGRGFWQAIIKSLSAKMPDANAKISASALTNALQLL